MLFAKRKFCRNFYLFMVFFFLLSLICFSASITTYGVSLSKIFIVLFFGIYFFIVGLGLLIILLYYYTTQFKKLYRKITIENTGFTWIIINLLIIGFLIVFLANSPKTIYLGLYLIIQVSIISTAHIGQWLYDRKNKKKTV